MVGTGLVTMTLKQLGSDCNNPMLQWASHQGFSIFLSYSSIYYLKTKKQKMLKRNKKWSEFIQALMIPQQPQGRWLIHVLSLNVHSDPVGKAFLSPFYRGKSWGSERVVTCLTSHAPAFRRKVAPGHPWSRTPHPLGPGGTPMALPMRQRRHRAPKRERGDLDVDPFVSPHPSVVQPPPGTRTLSWVPNTWKIGRASCRERV